MYKICPSTASYLLHNHVSVNTEQALGVSSGSHSLLSKGPHRVAFCHRSNANAGSAMPASRQRRSRDAWEHREQHSCIVNEERL